MTQHEINITVLYVARILTEEMQMRLANKTHNILESSGQKYSEASTFHTDKIVFNKIYFN